MSQNISLWGASYSNVPSVTLPKTGGGTASFTDVTDTTATASDVASGKYFYTANGTKTQGTSTSGGYVTQDANGYIVLSSTNGVPTLTSKTITANGTYNASSDNATGYSSVTVNVSGGSVKTATGTVVIGSYTTSVEFSVSNEPSFFAMKPYPCRNAYGYGFDKIVLDTDHYAGEVVGASYDGTNTYYDMIFANYGTYITSIRNDDSYWLDVGASISWSYSSGTLTMTISRNPFDIGFAINTDYDYGARTYNDYVLYYI